MRIREETGKRKKLKKNATCVDIQKISWGAVIRVSIANITEIGIINADNFSQETNTSSLRKMSQNEKRNKITEMIASGMPNT